MVVDLKEIQDLLEREVMERFDHRDLNCDTPYFEKLPPTPENFARVIREILVEALPEGHARPPPAAAGRRHLGRLDRGAAGPVMIELTRRYRFPAAHLLAQEGSPSPRTSGSTASAPTRPATATTTASR